MARRHDLVWAILLLASWPASSGWCQSTADSAVSFARDIRPLLSELCFQCHGPDEQQREGDLRLDREDATKRVVDGRAAVWPGEPGRSELWQRVTSSNPDERMPPPETGRSLSAGQLELLRRWILAGAPWEQHWSFSPPVRPTLPDAAHGAWARTPVDYFVLAELNKRGLASNPEASRERLIRRVTLGLTGLPPTEQEVDAFLADGSPRAYERLVERLLASPHYGERMAWSWLDGARYADTSGYQNDGPRYMWRWRDWIIDAFNQNQPFDQFTVEQLAGDLLPGATLAQRIATGFNRNHRGNAEGGIIPEEYQVEYVVDRVDTTATVWLGLTMGCARCHDHKYDPIRQREFYQLFAYFNNIPEYGRAIKEGNSPPYVVAPTDEQQRQLAALDRELADLEARWQRAQSELADLQLAWEQSQDVRALRAPPVPRGLVASASFDALDDQRATGHGVPVERADGTAAELRYEPEFTPMVDGREGKALAFDGEHCVEWDIGDFGYFDKFSVALWVKPHDVRKGTLISRMTDEDQADGWYLQLRDGHLQVNLVKRWLDDAIRVETPAQLAPDTWTHVAMVYDGSRDAQGIRVYLNGQPVAKEVRLNFLNQTFSVKDPLRIAGGGGPAGRFHGNVDEVRIFRRAITSDEVAILAVPEPVEALRRLPDAQRSAGQRRKLQAHFLSTAAPAEWQGLSERLVQLRERREAFVESLPTVMVMEEMSQPRETFVLRRGEYDKRGEKVTPGLPACLPPAPGEARSDRLGLARWLVSPGHPLTARVAVNRIWQMHFGTGLVATAEDFGVQGESPSHPELLDWLACELVRSGWDVKALHRLMVCSATYRQSGVTDPEKLAKDPDNRWLSRGPRFRMSAEMVRDQALAISGLLTARLGGPSVKPYQPADLWKDLATDTAYDQDHGANLYRRGLYTYWKRTVAPPTMVTFDAAGRETCQVRSTRTNTPLQALTLMNDVTFVEAARVLAQSVLLQARPSLDDRLRQMFRRCTARQPTSSEMQILAAAVKDHELRFRDSPAAARQLLAQGEFPVAEQLDPCELAAYTTLASMILNLDEVITR